MSKNNSLKSVSIKQLERELNRRKSAKIMELETERSTLAEKIRSLGGTVGTEEVLATPNKKVSKIVKIKKSMAKSRITNEKSLKDLLISIGEDGQTRTTTDYLSALTALGWKSASTKPYYVVAAALASQEKKNVFRRVSKGSYALNKS